ncbi:hypothetical protein L1765_14010 [Microaerobacter geothermalis]|uniref:hypothetical protein n=1 Tax=Microaerobacter geothermalis TaxID=674972 RepID=UPI001F2DA64B|nr:hypothetical protein [Microaerobacter geothermalis]MCF6095074.1 hypothetical protein [Microaerobacter geothermalis]
MIETVFAPEPHHFSRRHNPYNICRCVDCQRHYVHMHLTKYFGYILDAFGEEETEEIINEALKFAKEINDDVKRISGGKEKNKKGCLIK